MATQVTKSERKCKDCYYWNRHDLTYISKDSDCCAFWHIAYHYFELAGNRPNRECYKPKTQSIQLTLF